MAEAQLFPLAPMNAARETFKGIVHGVEEAIERWLNAADSSASYSDAIARLNAIVQALRTQLGKPPSFIVPLYLV